MLTINAARAAVEGYPLDAVALNASAGTLILRLTPARLAADGSVELAAEGTRTHVIPSVSARAQQDPEVGKLVAAIEFAVAAYAAAKGL
jgi:hypothetical protein